MPGLADLLYLGQADPRRQLAAMLSGQQPPGPGPAGPAPAGPVDPNAPAPAAQPVSADPRTGTSVTQNPAPGAPPPPGSPPQPAALTSSPDMSASYNTLANPPNLMSLYLQLDARNRASDQINKGFALIAANHAGNPAMARSIMDSASGGADAGGTVNNLMSLYSAQQQMAGQQQLLAQSPQIAAKLGMDEATVRAYILSGRGPELIKSLEPTEKQRDIQAEHDIFIKNGGSEEDWKSTYLPMILTGGIPGMTGDTHARLNALVRWKADPANQGKDAPGYLTDDTKWKVYSQDLSDAKTQFGGLNQSLDKFVGDMSEVANDPNLDKITGGITGGLQGLLPGDVKNLKMKMEGLQNEAKDMASRGGPKGVGQNIKTLGSSPEDFTNLGITEYRDNIIAPRMRQALTAQANAYGASGQANDMPGYLRLYLDQKLYGPGGDLDVGGSPKTVTPDTGPDGKPLKPPNQATIAKFKNDMERYGPEKALEHLHNLGFDTSGLR